MPAQDKNQYKAGLGVQPPESAFVAFVFAANFKERLSKCKQGVLQFGVRGGILKAAVN
jgi:hypothetical protein